MGNQLPTRILSMHKLTADVRIAVLAGVLRQVFLQPGAAFCQPLRRVEMHQRADAES